ncbi:amino acid carrier protein [Simiaoa sp.]|uniref:alanine/glycine:cation symporter family protein n=1 Tax=Simiaoa sp. TaxID=2944202 RepID=UPI0015A3FEA7
MITEVKGFLQQADRIVWGPWLIFLLLGCGCYLMISLRFLPLRNLLAALGLVFHSKSWKGTDGEGVSSFSALTTELAATIGTGNIVGVATAMVLGGPGALFWMLLSGIIGLSTKLVESTLCVRYRVRDHKRKPVGGPMYVLQNAFPYRRMGRILAVLFAIFAVLASFGMGNMTQGNSIAEALAVTFGVGRTATGLVLGILTILVILGGIDKIARVTEYLVPCMAVFYLFGTGMVIFTHLHNLPSGIWQILWGAFCPEAMAGGTIGFLCSIGNGTACSGRQAMRYGVSRGVFSNEAGLGAAGISAACADTSDAVRQGYISMTGVFIDTIVICSLTGLAIASSGMLGQRDAQGEFLNGTALMIAVFSSTFGRVGEWMLTLSIALFAFATIIAWEYQGEKAFEYLMGRCHRTGWYRVGYGIAAFLGAVCSLEAVWDFSDICNGLMAVPNLLAVVMLSKGICREIRSYKL